MYKFIMVSTIALSLFMTACTDSKEVQMVKNGELRMCDGVTIDQMTQSFMGSPKWESGKSKDGNDYVNVSGDISFQDKQVRAAIQFEIDKKNSSFKYRAFEMNGVPQADLFAIGLLNKMCASATEKYRQYDEAAISHIRNTKTLLEAFFADNQKYPARLEDIQIAAGDKVIKYAAEDGIRQDYKRVSENKYVLVMYHDKGSKKYKADSDSIGVNSEKK